MYLMTKRTNRINNLDLLAAGYKKVDQWKYTFEIKKGWRWHAIISGCAVYLHKDKTVCGRHRVTLSNIDKEICRIKNESSRILKNGK